MAVSETNQSEPDQKDYSALNTAVIIISVSITAVMSFFLIFKQFPSVWFDEVCSISFFTSDWKTMWYMITHDNHPPLYFFVMKIITTIFGKQYHVIKAAQLIPIFTLHLWSGILLIRNKEIIKKPFSGLFAVLFIFATFAPKRFMAQNVEIRMYSWAMFFVTMSGIYAYRLIKHHFRMADNYVFFILFSIAAALTHYYALFCEIFICLFVSGFILAAEINAKDKLILFLKLFIPIFIGCVWWVPFGFTQLQYSRPHIFWIQFSRPWIKDQIKYLISFDIRLELLFVFLIIFEAIHSVLLFGRENSAGADKMKTSLIIGIIFISMPALLLFSGIIISLLFRPFLVYRYIFPALGLFWLGLIMVVSCTRRHKIFFCGVLAACLLFLTVVNYPKQIEKELHTGTQDFIQFVNENVGKNDIFVTDIEHLRNVSLNAMLHIGVLKYYFPEHPVFGKKEFLSEIDTFENTAWWIVDIEDEINPVEFTDLGFIVDEVKTGDIDMEYYYTIYKIHRA